MKSSLFTTLLSLATMTLMVMTVGSSGLRGLQSISVDSLASTPSIKIAGLGNLLKIINSASEFTNSTFDVITIDSFSQNKTDEGVEYEGKVTLANDQGFNVSGLINGTWDPVNNKLVFSASPYVETGGSEDGGEDNGEGDNNSTNTTNPSNPAVPAGYAYISNEDLANNQRAQNALDYGVDALIQTAISQYKVPAASPEYNVTNLFFAAYRNTSYGNSFLFYTNLTNALNYKVDANLTIRYTSNNQTFKLAGYSFRSYGYPASAIVIPAPPQSNASNNTNNATNDTTIVVPDNTTVIVDNSTGTENTTIIVDNPNLPQNETAIDNSTAVDNSTVVIPPVNETTPINNSTNNTTNNTTPTTPTTPANQTTADGYTILSAAQLANDSIAQGALQAGANALIQKALSQNKIPAANANYTINNIYLAAAKRQVIGTSYKFAVNMTNVDYVHVDANLTVFYRYSTKAYSLNGYWFRSYNYSSSALQNNNATIPTPIANSTSPSNNTSVPANNTVVDNANPVANATDVAANNTVIDTANSGSR